MEGTADPSRPQQEADPVDRRPGLAGSVHLVTGAASGIGLAITTRLRAEGAHVMAVDRDAIEGDEDAFQADLVTREGNRSAVAATLERFGRLDAVVAGAGFQTVSPISAFDEDVWDDMLALMLTSPFLLARYAWPALEVSGRGRFAGIGSAHALVASAHTSAYVAAKHGLLGLVKTIAVEGAPVGLTATAVCPGYVRTPLVERQIAAHAELHGIAPERVIEDVLLAEQPIKRLLEPSEVAATVAFLLGPDGSGFSGVPVTMDGGWTAR